MVPTFVSVPGKQTSPSVSNNFHNTSRYNTAKPQNCGMEPNLHIIINTCTCMVKFSRNHAENYVTHKTFALCYISPY